MEPQNTPQQGTQKPTSLRVLDGQTELAEEDLIRLGEFFSKWGREILIAVAVAVAIFLVTKFLRETDAKQRKIASSKYEEARGTFSELKSAVAAQAGAKAEEASAKAQNVETVKAKLTEQLKVLHDAKEPYRSIADVYQALSFNLTGDAVAAKKLLAELDLNAKLSDPKADTMFIEFASINLGRALIDSPESFTDGWKVLITLTEKAKYVSTNAAIVLADVARTPEERAQAKSALDALAARAPESQEMLKASIKRLS